MDRPTPAATRFTLVIMRSTSAATSTCTLLRAHRASRFAYSPGAPVRRTRISRSPSSWRSATGRAASRASRWSTGMASSAGSCSSVSNTKPSGRATGTRRKPQCMRPACTASVISAALFSLTSSAMSGWRPRHRRSTSGVKAWAAAELVKPTWMRPRSPRAKACMRSRMAVKSASSRVASPCSSRPASVRSTPLGWRRNRAMPSSSSSARICCDSGGCCMPSSSAARVMWPVSATARK